MDDCWTSHTILLVGDDEEHDEDPFKRLPDDLIISHIFDKICEAKYLCKCALVSKHFSSLVYKTTTVSFKIHRQYIEHKLLNDPTSHQFPLSLPLKLLKLVPTPLWCMIHGLSSCLNMHRSRPRSTALDIECLVDFIARSIGKFKSIRSFNLEIDYPGYDYFRNDALVKWKFDSKTSSFILLVASIVLELEANVNLDDEDLEDEDIDNVVTGDLVKLLGTSFHRHVVVVTHFWTSMMEMLLPFFKESLQNVVVTDSNKKDRADIGGSNDVVGIRNSNIVGSRNGKLRVRFWFAPAIKLPYAGSVVKMVTLVICKSNQNESQDDRLLVEEAFDGEEKIYAEAAMEVLKKEHDHEGIL